VIYYIRHKLNFLSVTNTEYVVYEVFLSSSGKRSDSSYNTITIFTFISRLHTVKPMHTYAQLLKTCELYGMYWVLLLIIIIIIIITIILLLFVITLVHGICNKPCF
jgi:hypothetical protein